MRIARTRVHSVAFKLKRDLRTTHGPLGNLREALVVELISDVGISGFGEAATLPGFTGDGQRAVKLLLERQLLPAVIGLNVFEIGLAHRRMDRCTSNTAAKAAVDIALHDLMAKQAGIPLYQLLGGAESDTLRTSYDIGLGDPQEMVEDAKHGLARGATVLKVKLRGERQVDQELIKRIRELGGSEPVLWLDANEAYTASEVVRLLNALETCDISYLEQPVKRDDIDGLRLVRDAVSVPVVADESVFSPADAIRLINAEAADVFVIKLIKCGGIYRARQIAAIAETAGIACVLIQAIETGIGTAAAVHLAMALPNSAPIHGLDNSQFLVSDPAPGLLLTGSTVQLPVDPGLGVRWRAESTSELPEDARS